MRIHRHRAHKPKITGPQFKINDQVTADELRVIDETGAALGVMTREAAMKLAAEKNLDLIEVSPKANPPVVKFLEYGQFKYQKEKEMRKQRAQSKEIEVKGVRLSIRISEHDLDVRFEQAKKFLTRGDKVQAEIVLRGREKEHFHLAKEVIEGFVKRFGEAFPIRIEQDITRQGNRVTTTIARA